MSTTNTETLKDSQKKSSVSPSPEPNVEVEPEKVEPLFITWIYRPRVEGNNAPVCFQYPPNDAESLKVLAQSDLAKSNTELPMESKFLVEGMNSIPIDVVRAIQSHPASARALEYKVVNGSIEILEMDHADVEGVSVDTAASVHYTPIKAIKLINACYDLEALKSWKSREIGVARNEVRKAIDRRITMINDEIAERIKSQQSKHLES
ncbi:hypothetical protein [Pseudanabaena sp. 'Roaring Creek']|uniref:hypothetical protein n=1 Tax=Pseudanabaena sp. 'Roaring Creek' TaxID=1681830 RepID=UPI0006D79798|nr:hypothetical protein [Pseudanabaena sp. 'Roaring Creek']